MKKAFHQFRGLTAVALATALVACGGGGGGTPPNTAPIAATVTDMTVLAGSAFSFVLPAFSDEQGNALTYSLTRADDSALPAGLSLDPATRTVSGTTALTMAGPLALKIKATDTGGLSASATFTLNAVRPGIYQFAQAPTLFYGVVLPGATGVADVWTWELQEAQDANLGFSKYYTGNVGSLGASLATTAANRRVYVAANANDELNYTLNANTTVAVSALVTSNQYSGSQRFVVGPANGTTIYNAPLDGEWSNSATPADWNGVWILKETLPDTSVVTTRWTVNNGSIVGTKKTGTTTLCDVTGTVGVSAADKAVARISVRNTCGQDIDDYSGISFSQKRVSGSVTDRAVIMGLSNSARFVTKSFCRVGANNPTCTE